MSGITLAQAEAQLASWLSASTAVASNQSYKIKDRELTRADASQIREMIAYWQGMVTSLSGRAGRARRVFYVGGSE
jgi:hypothetical protein